MKIKFIANAVEWFDRVNGNFYHSVRVLRLKDNAVLKSNLICYGYGDAYRDTALKLMLKHGWIDKKYTEQTYYLFERENNYPIYWHIVRNAKKREMIANVA